MEQAHARFIAARSGGSLVLEGRIRLGITEGLASQWLIPGLSGFQSAHPALEVSFDAAHAFSGLGEQVDAAIRFSPPVELDEVGRRVGVLHFSLFAPKDYAARHGLPSAINELGKHRFVDHTVYRDHIPSLAPWTTLLAGLTVTLRTPNYLNVWAAMRQGLGMAVLPNYVVRAYPDLVKAPLDLGWRSDIWVIFREPARHVPRVRAVVEEIVRIGKRDQATFFES
jgi:DNA-binding transcriptional LysR family regulator